MCLEQLLQQARGHGEAKIRAANPGDKPQYVPVLSYMCQQLVASRDLSLSNLFGDIFLFLCLPASVTSMQDKLHVLFWLKSHRVLLLLTSGFISNPPGSFGYQQKSWTFWFFLPGTLGSRPTRRRCMDRRPRSGKSACRKRTREAWLLFVARAVSVGVPAYLSDTEEEGQEEEEEEFSSALASSSLTKTCLSMILILGAI